MIKIKSKDKYEMWCNYLKILNTQSKNSLTKREIEILAFAISQPITIQNPLRGIARKGLKSFLGMSEQNLSMHRSSLVEKGFIEHDSSLLNESLQRLRESFEKSNGKKIVLNIEISYE
jgi:DNA-binding MarR family transcriptional regulator